MEQWEIELAGEKKSGEFGRERGERWRMKRRRRRDGLLGGEGGGEGDKNVVWEQIKVL